MNRAHQPGPPGAAQPSVLVRVIDRLLDRRPAVRRAVLREVDQVRNVWPAACVKSGTVTDGAITIRAVEAAHGNLWVILFGQAATALVFRIVHRPMATVSLPVSVGSFRLWRTRLAVAAVISTMGTALAIVGVIRGITGMVVAGIVILALGWLNRVRAWHNAWVAVEYRSAKGEFVVSRVHSTFDAEAKAIYTAGLNTRVVNKPGINTTRRP